MSGIYQAPAMRAATGAFIESVLAAILPPVREVARDHGYAIAVHGSLARDIDLLACPWREDADPADELVKSIVVVIGSILGRCCQNGPVGIKPHGRRAYTLIHNGHIGEIDLSIMPIVTVEP
ncbi:MAG: hypothetical protein DI605_06775 [Sphingomonas sp.]|nr:MAG: hypothetical protein DI605_06775 [Sphingomonas sp.]